MKVAQGFSTAWLKKNWRRPGNCPFPAFANPQALARPEELEERELPILVHVDLLPRARDAAVLPEQQLVEVLPDLLAPPIGPADGQFPWPLEWPAKSLNIPIPTKVGSEMGGAPTTNTVQKLLGQNSSNPKMGQALVNGNKD